MTRLFWIALSLLSTCTLGFAQGPVSADKLSKATKTIALFNGKTLDGWSTLKGAPVTKGWEVKNGMLHREKRGGHIVTEQEFGDFELEFEWKIGKRGNSGVKYRLKKFGSQWLGCEYQLYDDRGKPGSASATGALYALYPPPKNKPLKPVGEFNTSRIVVRGERVEHWLNGEKIVEAKIGSEDWNRRVARSKFNKYDGFAKTSRSKIMLQDHGSEVWFRKITLRLLAQ